MKPGSKPDAISLMSAMNSTPPMRTSIADASAPKPVMRKTGTRAGTCQIAGHFPISTRRALKHLEAEEGRKLQDLLDEAIQDFLIKKGKAKLVGA
jgi:hypothetical protein